MDNTKYNTVSNSVDYRQCYSGCNLYSLLSPLLRLLFLPPLDHVVLVISHAKETAQSVYRKMLGVTKTKSVKTAVMRKIALVRHSIRLLIVLPLRECCSICSVQNLSKSKTFPKCSFSNHKIDMFYFFSYIRFQCKFFHSFLSQFSNS